MNSRHLCRLIVVRVAALTVVIIGLSISSASATSTEAKAMAVKGDVKSGPPAAPALPQVQQGSNIHVGHAVNTAEVSELLMSPFQGSAVRVLEKSSVILQEADLQKSGEKVIGRKAVLELKKGTGQVIVDPRQKTDIKITTPQCVAAARGTVYQTAVVDKETTVTIVLRGEVVVTCEDSKGRHETVVKAGMKLTTRKKRGEGGKESSGPTSRDRGIVSVSWSRQPKPSLPASPTWKTYSVDQLLLRSPFLQTSKSQLKNCSIRRTSQAARSWLRLSNHSPGERSAWQARSCLRSLSSRNVNSVPRLCRGF